MKKSLLIVLMGLLISACAPQIAKISNTESGKPEAVIAAPVDYIKSAIIGDMVNYGYQIEKDGQFVLELARRTKGSEDSTAAMLVGNAYSTNYKVASYSFVKTPAGIRVIVSSEFRAQMIGGQQRTLNIINNGSVYNDFQKQLYDIKEKLETGKH